MKLKKLLPLVFLISSAAGCTMQASGELPVSKENSAASTDQAAVAAGETNGETQAEATPRPAKKQPLNAVCPDPAKPCRHPEKQFDEWELSFKMPSKLQANKSYESAEFYAVILKTYEMEEECDGGEYIEAAEAERRSEQKNHVGRKVFASYECPNMSAVIYEFEGRFDAKRERIVTANFIAVYAGETMEEAEEILREVKSRFPKAEIKRMKAIYEKIVQ